MKIRSNEKITTLKNKVNGQIVLPDDSNYNEVRQIWNAMIDRRPAVIVQCTEANDVLHAISYARENGLEISIRDGGFGWLTRKYGMTIDNLVSAEMVTADGTKIRVSENENTDLFWAIRGGGGNFGRKAPPLPFLPEDVHGKEVVVLAIFYTGDIAEGEKLIDPLRRFGAAYGEHIGAQPYAQWQQAFDPLLTPGARNYWKSHNFTELSDGALNSIIEYAGKLPSPQCEIFIGLRSGAANRVPSDAMAYGHRDAKFVLNVHGRWDEAAQDETCIAWARAFFEASKPYASAGVYVNFMTGDEGDRVAAAYGVNYNRLRQIKKKYDPENIFYNNQNIKT